MQIKKTTLRSATGVRLELIEKISAHGKLQDKHYRLSTMRPNQPCVLADRDNAEDAFDLEVIASLTDPVVQRLIAPN